MTSEKMEWISVKDRLPELDVEVLVFINGVSSNGGIYQSISVDNLTEYRSAPSEHSLIQWTGTMCCGDKVTHWMSLPQPPKDHV